LILNSASRLVDTINRAVELQVWRYVQLSRSLVFCVVIDTYFNKKKNIFKVNIFLLQRPMLMLYYVRLLAFQI